MAADEALNTKIANLKNRLAELIAIGRFSAPTIPVPIGSGWLG